jgi:DNA-binding response OmpR family regulator
VYKLPFYTDSEFLSELAVSWSGYPVYSLEPTPTTGSSHLQTGGAKPPVVVVAATDAVVRQQFIAKMYEATPSQRPYIIALTDSTDESVLVELLQQGSDRALSTSQCSPAIFRALINTLLPKSRTLFHYEPYHFNAQNQTVSVGGQSIRLRRKLFEIAHYLFINHGKMVTKESMLLDVWGMDDLVCRTRRVESQISLVKKQLQLDGTHGWTLRSNRGMDRGYGLFRVSGSN